MSVKYDSGKPKAGLVLGAFGKALMQVASVGTFGADKYTPNGWLNVENSIDRYTDALWRHLLLMNDEVLDCESGLPHASHVAWNALAVLELIQRREKKNSRFSVQLNSLIEEEV